MVDDIALPIMSQISVITPLHNKGPYIRETIRSLQRQSLTDWELLVVENHSTDDGPERVQRISEEDSRIQFLQAPSAVRGPGAARNHGIERAMGKYLLFLDADDLLDSQHLESLLRRAGETNADIVASDWLEFRDGPAGANVPPPGEMTRKQATASIPGRISLSESAIAFAPWAVHCALVKADGLTPDRRWAPELDRLPSEDTAFWFRAIQNRHVEWTNQHTAIYRTHSANYRNQHEDIALWLRAMTAITNANLAFLEQLGERLTLRHCEMLMRMWENIAIRAVGASDYAAARVARRNAEEWLDRCFSAGGVPQAPLKWRRRLGLSAIIYAKAVSQSVRPKRDRQA